MYFVICYVISYYRYTCYFDAMSDRHYMTGYQKRKLKEKREQEKVKHPKLTDFFVSNKTNIPAEETTCQPSTSQITIDNANERSCLQVPNYESTSSQNQNDNENAAAEEETCQSGISKEATESEEKLERCNKSFAELDTTFDGYQDLGLWPDCIDNDVIRLCLAKDFSYFQNYDHHNRYPKSEITCEKHKRRFSNSCFSKTLKNGQQIKRQWLCYSPSSGLVYCIACKVFSNVESRFKTGVNDWSNILRLLDMHQESKGHKQSILTWFTRKTNKHTIDKELEEQTKKEITHFYQVLQRVVAVLKFLCQRGLALRGHEEKWGSPNNGNFMGIIELISEFDPFLKEHLKKCQSSSGRTVSYLSKTTYEELIAVMGKQVLRAIIDQINNKDVQYYSIIVDSTPDLAHIDQLAIVVRYCYQGLTYERFLTFIPIENHTSEYLFQQISAFLNKCGLSLQNIRGQSYDNAANMSGRYNGVQARFKSINKFADFVPCSAHSLNLVGVEAVKLIPEVVDYFGIIQSLYVFFSASPHRWNLVSTIGKLQYALKSLSATRWCAHYEAVRALKIGYDDILKTLKHINMDETEKTDCRNEAKNLYKKIIRLEFGMLTLIWEQILERFNKVSTKLQSPGLDIQEGYHLLDSLKQFLQDVRKKSESETDRLEANAKELSEDIEKEFAESSKRKRKILLANKETEMPMFIGKVKFRVEIINKLLDFLINDLHRRSSVYQDITVKFKCLFDIGDISKDDIDIDAVNTESFKKLIEYYNEDLEEELISEALQFKKYLKISNPETKINKSCSTMLNIIYSKEMIDVFPNLYTALKIFLTLPVTSCEAERSFSKLTIIKNKYRTVMTEKRLQFLGILSIESDFTCNLNYDDAIREFADIKIRKKSLFL